MTEPNAIELTFTTFRYVGCWQIGGSNGVRFHLVRKPRWLARVMAKWLLQWEWIDVHQD